MITRRINLLMCCAVALGIFVIPPPQSAAADVPAAGALPAPFDGWHVRLEPATDATGVLDLSFDSPILGERVTNRVYLPSHPAGGTPLPVVYYLHGTALPLLDNTGLLQPVTSLELLTSELGAGGGRRQIDLMDFGSQRGRANFIVVAPDSDATHTICQTCVWIDGQDDAVPNLPPVTGKTVRADSFLNKELYPLVETLFRTRTDRGGRGVMGFSMGGTGAYLQAFMHPDRYGFVASYSGPIDVREELLIRLVWEAFGYNRDQGYGLGLVGDDGWRGVNPADLVSNVQGVDLAALASVGDGCLPLTSLLTADCTRYSAVTNPAASAAEVIAANNFARTAGVLARQVRVQLPGVHGANNHRVYADRVVGWANDIFSRTIADPETFQYRSTMPEFAVWGYSASTHHAQSDFVELDGRRDGSSFTVTGSGTFELTTPPAFRGGGTYSVTITDQTDGSTRSLLAQADPGGHVQLDIHDTPGTFAYSVTIRNN